MNGAYQPNPDRQGSPQCVNATGEAVPCCVWQPHNWAVGYMSVAALVALWTLLLANQIRVFTVSGTIAQWWVMGRSQVWAELRAGAGDAVYGR